MDLSNAFEFLEGRLYYIPMHGKPERQRKAAFFSIDEELVYWNFFKDFGPLNLGQLFRFSQILEELLTDPKLDGKKIIYYSSAKSEKRANAAFLICSFMMIKFNQSPAVAYAPFKNVYPPFPPYHDATPYECTYKLTVYDCLCGIRKALDLGFFDFKNFDIDEYETFERVECGDLNWIIPGKFLAFAGPYDRRMHTSEGYDTLTPEFYIPYFKKMNVTLVIRLNRKCYDEKRFECAGIKHLDLVYPDGTCPPDYILRKFLEACQNNVGGIAVHCKAGLGRTGTCIGAYIMKHFDMTAAETIAWLRVCRPGSVIGPQQHFMEQIQPLMRLVGKHSTSSTTNDFKKTLSRNMSLTFDHFETKHEEKTEMSQGDWLRSKKILINKF